MIVEEQTQEVELSPRRWIAEHPLVAAGAAAAIGAGIALVRTRKSTGKGVLRGMIGGLALALIREAALDKMSRYASSWIDMRVRDETAARQREAALEH